jgi:tetraacyldisaccharide 4'-kinase
MMRAPDFWAKPGHAAALALLPLSWLWRGLMALDAGRARPQRVGVPVLSVGNLVLGGAGKTPVALALAERLAQLGAEPHILSKGYGGSEPGPLRVDAAHHQANAVGDEALLLARIAPTWVARDRSPGAKSACAAGATIILLDDGHQTWGLAKDFSIVVVDAGYGFGNGSVFPAGPLREPIQAGLARANLIVVVENSGETSGPGDFADAIERSGKPVARADLVAGPEGAELAGKNIVAFAGIGRPEKFFATVRATGANLATTRAFADHHPYSDAEFDELRQTAQRLGAQLVTTAKDAVRLKPSQRESVTVLSARLEFQDPATIDEILRPLLGGTGI